MSDINRNGAGVVGRGQRGHSAAELAQEFYDRGFRKLTVEAEDGHEAGGITQVKGVREWWGES